MTFSKILLIAKTATKKLGNTVSARSMPLSYPTARGYGLSKGVRDLAGNRILRLLLFSGAYFWDFHVKAKNQKQKW
jgi:hypothetical protein